MRCPDCHLEQDTTARACAGCGGMLAGGEPQGGAHLGIFHPAVAGAVAALLERKGIPHHTIERDDAVEVRLGADWRDDVRAELAVTWPQLLRDVAPDDLAAVHATGGSAPGWLDAPRGGHIDRAGRLVVDVSGEDDDLDAARVFGPLLLTAGSIAAIVGWWVLDSSALTIAGVGLALVGLFTPR